MAEPPFSRLRSELESWHGWLVVDREVVIEFDNDQEKVALLSGLTRPYLDIRDSLRQEAPGLWGTPDPSDSFGDELDFLALGPNGDLICIELKHGSNTSGIYWGPLQVAVYVDEFKWALRDISEDVNRLVKQKVILGLLPSDAELRLPVSEGASVRGILAVADPDDRRSCWARLTELMTRFPSIRTAVAEIRSYRDPGVIPRVL